MHKDFEVYAQEDDIDDAEECNSSTKYIRRMMVAVYTKEAMKRATPTGFPARGKGKSHLIQKDNLPRLHPHGIKAIISK